MRNLSWSMFFITVLSFLPFTAYSQDDTLVKRGKYMVESYIACSGCHMKDYSGGITIKEHTFTAHVPNITQDIETGIGSWTDDQIARAIREGMRPNGRIIGDPMPLPLYRYISDNDIKAIVAYLRTIKPVRRIVGKSTYPDGLPDSYGPPVANVKDIPRTDKVAYGEYIARLAHCPQCHTPVDENFKRKYDDSLGAGGAEYTLRDGSVIYTANLTPAGNLPGYSDEEIKTIIQTGIRPDGSHLVEFMDFSYYKKISDQDMDALIAYLRSLTPVE